MMAGIGKKIVDVAQIDTLEKQMAGLNTGKKRDINILLLGETGVGKSTFINSFCNYLQNSNLKSAMNRKLTTLIPVKFTITNADFETQNVEVGADTNEFAEVGASATQSSKSYVFPIKKAKLRVRLIDTPGIGDTRGIEQDNINFENILSFIGELNHLNAICILLKPNNSRLTVMFEFCIKQLLSKLEKSASKNLIFVFTNARSSFYRPGETLPALRKLLSTIKTVDIPLNKDNIFCMDNEAFNFLAAVNNGIKFNTAEINNFSESWKQSALECEKIISYIAGDANQTPLTPHMVKNTISVNEARRIIVQLSQPLAEIAQSIQDNVMLLRRHKASLELSNTSLEELKTKLFVPVMDLRVIQLDQPTTVCTSIKCRTLYKVGHIQKWHYDQKCHKPCYLRNIPKEIIGPPELAKCSAMNHTTTCQKCDCSFQVHMHIYYETESYMNKLEDDTVKSQINDKNLALLVARNTVQKIEKRIEEYDQERNIILQSTAKFAHFLQENAITAYNDAYQGYLYYLIDREKSLGKNANYETIKELQKMLAYYNEEKHALEQALARSPHNECSITADEIITCVEGLYNLKHNGAKLIELLFTQKAAYKDENKSDVREYVYAGVESKKPPKKKKNKKQVNNAPNSRYSMGVTRAATDNSVSNQRFNYRGNYVQKKQPNLINPFNRQYQQMQMHNNSSGAGPIQYFHMQQDPSGRFDLRVGQSRKYPGDFNQSSSVQSMPLPNKGYGGQNNGQFEANRKTYNTMLPTNQFYNTNYQRSTEELIFHTNNPNTVGYQLHNGYDFQYTGGSSVPNHSNQFNQTLYKQRPNYRRGCDNRARSNYAANPSEQLHSQGTQAGSLYQRGSSHYRGGRSRGRRACSQEPPRMKFNNNQKDNCKTGDILGKPDTAVQLDLGYQSAGHERQSLNNRNFGKTPSYDGRHFLFQGNSSSSSSSTSSDSSSEDELYLTCKKY